MSPCKHTEWLTLASRKGKIFLQRTDRLSTLLEDRLNLDSMQPSLFVFFGGEQKAMLMKKLLKKSHQPQRVSGEMHLHIDTSGTFSNGPVLLAEGGFPQLGTQTAEPSPSGCHESWCSELSPGLLESKALGDSVNTVFFKLLTPFADVLCFFAADLGGFRPIIKELALWLESTKGSLQESSRPQILIVTDRNVADERSSLRTFTQMLANETNVATSKHFSNIRILSINFSRKDYNKSRYCELKECLRTSSNQMRATKIGNRTLFTTRHFAAFFDHALNNIVRASIDPFNFIISSRAESPVVERLSEHLTNFLQHVRSPRHVREFAVPTIASSFLLDNYYPPSMHVFNPSDVFRTLYKEACLQACPRGKPSIFAKDIEDEFVRQFGIFAKTRTSGAQWHENTLARFVNEWQTIQSDDKICFVCLRTSPQINLPCGHFTCIKCILIFGARTDMWRFQLDHCLLCREPTPGIFIEIKPPTHTSRVLSIDGGGVRAVIPLTFLLELEKEMRLGAVQNNFDFGIFSSSGAIVGLDSVYSSRNLEAALQEAYTSTRGILDYSHASAIGTKIGITVSSMEPKTSIFNNYNSQGNHRNGSYGVLQGNAPVWEIARASSAAPFYFTTKTILGFGKFQDGGIRHNNPIQLALDELEALHHEDPLAKRSALKVSLGTGKSGKGITYSDPDSWWRDRWFFRLGRTLLSAINSEEKSNEMHQRELKCARKSQAGEISRHGEYFRFDVTFDGEEPELDDVSKMPELKALASDAIQPSSLTRLANCLVANLFVFELDSGITIRKRDGARTRSGSEDPKRRQCRFSVVRRAARWQHRRDSENRAAATPLRQKESIRQQHRTQKPVQHRVFVPVRKGQKKDDPDRAGPAYSNFDSEMIAAILDWGLRIAAPTLK
ncbi:hypothetical protein VE03_10316 [Pseudogymnoascus sp. 23342-1-I1]|nr:hypothetical protein VE03_10316 [Pseudogymnoascus sp. 23342-1-I1]